MTTPDTSSKPDNTPYIAAALIGLAVFWRWGDFTMAVMALLVCVAAVYAYQIGVLAEAEKWLRPQLYALWLAFRQWLAREPAGEYVPEPYEIYVGQVNETREHVFSNLEELGSFGVYAVTGGGKTSFLHAFIHRLISHNTPNELQLAIADLKGGLDFRIYRRLPHLLLPIADNTAEAHQAINGLLEEMSERGKLFKAIPPDRLCNNLDDYHRLKNDLLLNHLPDLPRIVAIFDESQNITLESDAALSALTKLAKEGRAFGISVICATQLPNVEAIPTKLKSQFSSMFCGWLTNPSHYYKIVETVKEHWEPFHKGGKVPGRFIASIAGEILIIQAPWVPRRQLEALAREWSQGREEPQWPEKLEPSETPAHPWTGSSDEKRAMVIAWLRGFDEIPSDEEFRAKFQTSRATYYNWVPQLWDEING